MKLSLKLSIITLVIIATAVTIIFFMNQESNEIKVESTTVSDAKVKAQKQAKMKKWSEQLKNAQALKQVEQVKKIEKEIENELPSRYKKLLKLVRDAVSCPLSARVML